MSESRYADGEYLTANPTWGEEDSVWKAERIHDLWLRTALPVPSVLGVQRFGERWGIAMTRAAGVSFADAMIRDPGLVPDYLRGMAALHVHVHRQLG